MKTSLTSTLFVSEEHLSVLSPLLLMIGVSVLSLRKKPPTKEIMLSVHAISVIPRSIRLPSSWFAESRSITRFTSASITSHRSIRMTEPTLIGLCLPKWLRFGYGAPRGNSSLVWRTGVTTAKTMQSNHTKMTM